MSERRRLKGHRNVTRTTVHGRTAILTGVVVLLLALLLLGFGTGVLPSEEGGSGRTIWPVSVVGLIVLLIGIRFVFHGLSGIRSDRRAEALLREWPDEPWRADHPWDPDGGPDDGGAHVRTALVQVVAVNVIFVPLGLFVLSRDEVSVVPKVMAGLLLLVCLGAVLRLLGLFLRRVKYGVSRLRYARFPFFLGEEFEAHLRMVRDLREFDRIELTLRHVEETIERRGKNCRIVAYETWSERSEVEVAQLSSVEADRLEIRFRLPEDGTESFIRRRPARYWELVVRAEAPGIDYRAAFLVPVYRRPG